MVLGLPLHPSLLWGAAHCVTDISVIQMTIHAHKGLLQQLGVALLHLSRATATERHYRAWSVPLPHLLQ
jgi:hypothetical protein